MNIKSIQSLLIVVVLLASCGVANSQKGKLLTPEVFEKMLHETPDAQVIDVRTPEEFNDGHLKNALNMNVNSKDFENRAPYLDKAKPLFVYCYSGGRSAKACEYFEKMGFKVIYDMEGGYSAWTDANLPVEGKKADKAGISLDNFALLTSGAKVLVDINAPWCPPCVKMKPMLDSLDIAWKDKVKIVRLNKDENQLISKSLQVNELPTLLFYENGKLVKRESGYKNAEQLKAMAQVE
ncbi:MAG: thioredoxin fold domain-containing protein [Bacteroidetes bacterium]|nr:thioredoxin fold domain-containing protein [Bacteroidota bacterium]